VNIKGSQSSGRLIRVDQVIYLANLCLVAAKESVPFAPTAAADKLLTSSAFISLVELGLAPAWMIVVIVGREFAVSGMRSVAAARGLVMAASPWGKLKTVSQVVAIVLLILTNTLERWGRFGFLGKVMLWLVLLAAVGSAADYFRKFLRTMDTWPSPQS